MGATNQFCVVVEWFFDLRGFFGAVYVNFVLRDVTRGGAAAVGGADVAVGGFDRLVYGHVVERVALGTLGQTLWGKYGASHFQWWVDRGSLFL